jgi:hypothetical protein
MKATAIASNCQSLFGKGADGRDQRSKSSVDLPIWNRTKRWIVGLGVVVVKASTKAAGGVGGGRGGEVGKEHEK